MHNFNFKDFNCAIFIVVCIIFASCIFKCNETINRLSNITHDLVDQTDSFIKEHPKTNEVQFPNKYIGQFKITHYCSCPICTQKSKPGLTATSHKPKEGRTVAVDPKKIPLHSIIYIEDLGYFVAEDIGGGVKGDHIDIYLNTHKEAIQRGTLKGKRKKVYLMKLI